MKAICITDSYNGWNDISKESELTNGKSYVVIEHYGIFEKSQWGGHVYIKNDKGYNKWYRFLSQLYQGEPYFKILDNE